MSDDMVPDSLWPDAATAEDWAVAESAWGRTQMETRAPPPDSAFISSGDWRTHRCRYRTIGELVFVSEDGGPWEEAVWINGTDRPPDWVPARLFPEYRTPEGRAKHDADFEAYVKAKYPAPRP